MAIRVGQANRNPIPDPDAVSEERNIIARKVSDRFRREKPRFVRQLISVGVARASSRVAWSLPDSVRYWLADRLGDLLYVLTPGYRLNVRSNLGHVHASIGRPPPTTEDVHNVFRISSRNWADLLVVPGRSERQFRDEVLLTPDSKDHLDSALARGKGCILITAHLGAFDYIAHYLHACGYTLSIVIGRTTARLVFDGVTYLRQANGLSLVEATPSGIRKVIQTVKNGGCAVIVSDRDFFQNGLDVNFFGVDTSLPPGAVRIARDTGASIVPVYGQRVDGGHELSIHEPFIVERTSNLQDDLRTGMARVVSSLELALARVPDQWVMFQSVWPQRRVDDVRKS